MKTLRIATLAVFLVAAQFSRVAYGGDSSVTGELVILKGTTNRFRIVDHPGAFTAPAGTSLEDFDGKAVEVQLATDGRVLQIREKVIPIEPIEHSIEVITGELVVVDAAAGKFTISGNSRLYVAPEGVELQSYDRRRVKIRLNDRAEVTALSLAPLDPPGTAP